MVAARFGAITSQDRDQCPSTREGVNGRRLIVNLEKTLEITWGGVNRVNGVNGNSL